MEKELEMMPLVYDDGGRSKYFYGHTGDCVCRAIAIASGRDYKEIYNGLATAMKKSPRNGVMTSRKAFKDFMCGLGFVWVSLCSVGAKTSHHLLKGELPNGRLCCSAHRHYVAVIDGVVHDIWDSRYNSWCEPRRIYGYWKYNK